MTSSTVARAYRSLRRERRRLSAVARHARAVLELAHGSVRLALQPRFALRKRRLLLGSAPYLPGLFSQFATVLGLLEHYDRWRERYDGVEIDFAREGLYYDARTGDNWWSYYFEPVAPAGERNAPLLALSSDQQFHFARRVESSMPRRLGAALVARYIRPEASLAAEATRFAAEHFAGAHALGVHYRGTDKSEDAPRVPYERVRTEVLAALAAAGRERHVLFVATDEQAFLDYMRSQFPGQVRYLETTVRSTDGRPIDVISGDHYKKGRDAVLDCLLLARCDALLRTASNLSLCATFFNPNLPVVLFNREQ